MKSKTNKNTNPKDLLGIKKVQLNLVPPASIIYEALALEDGAEKYTPYNWRKKKVVASIYVAAAMRHLLKWWDGQDLDEKSGKHELGHVKAGLGIVIDAIETGNLIDDRPPKGTATKIINSNIKTRKKKK